jgi:hypothetical protein
MIPQNLDVYETFPARGSQFKNLSKISNVAIDSRVRERLSGGSAEVDCHMLFHLTHPFIRGRKHNQVLRALERLVDRHGNANYGDYTLKLTFPRNPHGLYLHQGWRP